LSQGISLGFHALESGINELPPLPLWLKSEDKKPLIVNIMVKSCRDPMVYHQAIEPVFIAPFLIQGGKSPNQNHL
jgi:hypothetical protein